MTQGIFMPAYGASNGFSFVMTAGRAYINPDDFRGYISSWARDTLSVGPKIGSIDKQPIPGISLEACSTYAPGHSKELQVLFRDNVLSTVSALSVYMDGVKLSVIAGWDSSSYGTATATSIVVSIPSELVQGMSYNFTLR